MKTETALERWQKKKAEEQRQYAKRRKERQPHERCANQDEGTNCWRCGLEYGDDQADCSLFVPMGDPQNCPKCGKELSELVMVRRLEWYGSYKLRQGELDELYTLDKWPEVQEVIRVVCPKCSKALPFTSIDEAKEFLKNGNLPAQE